MVESMVKLDTIVPEKPARIKPDDSLFQEIVLSK